jgi:hypothetical protein
VKSTGILAIALGLACATLAQEQGRPGQGGERPTVPPLLAALDTNGDGVIDAEEIARASESLKKLDRNNDGRITMDEALSPRRGGMLGPSDFRGPGGQGFPAGGRRGQRPDAGSGIQRFTPALAADGTVDLAMLWSQGRAAGKGPVKLKTFPVRLDDIGSIMPMGGMIHGHVTPSQHLGISPRQRDVPTDRYDVLAPADGFIVQVQRSGGNNPDPGVRRLVHQGNYWVVTEHTGTYYTYTGLIEHLAPALLESLGGEPQAGPPRMTRIPVTAGQVIGKFGGGHGLDFAAVNTEVTLKGFVNPAQFNGRDPSKPHMVDPFDYVDEPLRSQLLARNARQVAPFGGKIDYDIDGRLVGNWYREGTGGYAGVRGQLAYWIGHVTLAYHHIDPARIIVSLGDFAGQPRQFAVQANGPDPAKVSAETGLVKYELVYAPLTSTGESIGPLPSHMRGVQGVLLVQLVDNRKLRLEVFPGKTAAEVTGFTDAAMVYER